LGPEAGCESAFIKDESTGLDIVNDPFKCDVGKLAFNVTAAALIEYFVLF
jgi:hypothetical protein